MFFIVDGDGYIRAGRSKKAQGSVVFCKNIEYLADELIGTQCPVRLESDVTNTVSGSNGFYTFSALYV